MGYKEKLKQAVRAEMRRSQPWIAAVFNFFVWGLGYIWNRGRMLLGFALCTFIVTLFGGAFIFMSTPTVATLNVVAIAVICAWVFVSFALAIDAYQDAKAAQDAEKEKK